MDIVLLFAERWKMTPFEVLNTDVDNFIYLFNYFVNLEGGHSPTQPKGEREEAADFWAVL